MYHVRHSRRYTDSWYIHIWAYIYTIILVKYICTTERRKSVLRMRRCKSSFTLVLLGDTRPHIRANALLRKWNDMRHVFTYISDACTWECTMLLLNNSHTYTIISTFYSLYKYIYTRWHVGYTCVREKRMTAHLWLRFCTHMLQRTIKAHAVQRSRAWPQKYYVDACCTHMLQRTTKAHVQRSRVCLRKYCVDAYCTHMLQRTTKANVVQRSRVCLHKYYVDAYCMRIVGHVTLQYSILTTHSSYCK